MSLFYDESIPEIIKDIDCLQETQQHSVTIKHNWSISDICELINTKRPGEKVESEQFSYNKSTANKSKNKDDDLNYSSSKSDVIYCKSCLDNCPLDPKNNTNKSLSNNTHSNTSKSNRNVSPSQQMSSIPVFSSSSLPFYTEIVCDYFLNNSQWRLEINKTPNDLDYISISAILLQQINPIGKSDPNLIPISQNLDKLNINFILKLRFFLFNSEMNEIFERQTFETKIEFKKFFTNSISTNLKTTTNQNGNSNNITNMRTKLIDRFTIDKFCRIKDLLKWLNTHKSDDFSLLAEFKVYNQIDQELLSKTNINFDTKSRLRTKFNNFSSRNGNLLLLPNEINKNNLSSSNASVYSSSNSSSSSSPSPPPPPSAALASSLASALPQASANMTFLTISPPQISNNYPTHSSTANIYQNQLFNKTKLNINSCSDSNSYQSTLLDRTSILIISYKHVWTIKNWRNFLMPGSNSHTFMNDLDISNIFSNLNLLSQDYFINKQKDFSVPLQHQQQQQQQQSNEFDSIKFGKFRSKLFSLNTNNIETKKCCSSKEDDDESTTTRTTTAVKFSSNMSKSKIENLLKDVKWKLQLYPNGYNQDFEQNLSLFVNFSQLTGELAQFSPPSSSNKKYLSNQTSLANTILNNPKMLEQTFYDSDEQNGLILLIKSPSSASLSENLNEFDDYNNLSSNNNNNNDEYDFTNPTTTIETNNENDERVGKRKKRGAQNQCETFVKASFQISILDSNGRKVDKCQSEKQLFELFGSWGYKEYMTAKDLVDAKERYLTNNQTTLNLNCKIILFYTITKKTNLNCINELPMVNLAADNYNSTFELKLTNPLPSFKKSESSNFNQIQIETNKIYENETLINSNTNNNNKSLNHSISIIEKSNSFTNKSTLKKTTKTTMANPLKECNSLLYSLRRLFKQSDMYDLIIQAPINLDEDFSIDFNNSTINTNSKNFKQFKVHKLILAARSEVFEKMFNNTNNNYDSHQQNDINSTSYKLNDNKRALSEKNFNKLDLVNSTTSSLSNKEILNIIDFDAYIVEIFLNYLYTDNVEINIENSSFNSKSNEICNKFNNLSDTSDDENNNLSNCYVNKTNESCNEDEDDEDENDSNEKLLAKNLRNELYTHLFIELFKISDKYCVHRLKQICEWQLIKLINNETTVELLILAYLHNSNKLKRYCFKYLADNVSCVISQPSWIYLEKNYPSLLAEAFRILYFKQNNNRNK